VPSGGAGESRTTLAVGFVDLVGFTALSHRLEAAELGKLLSRFESLVFDIVTEAGGRVVKLIGDEAMLVCPDPAGAVRAAFLILGRTGDADLPAARAGIAAGELLLQGGDYFGEPVNLASRIVDRAPPGAVMVDERVADAANGWIRPGRLPETSLQGIGAAALWRARVRP
jgi:adenylate cyclase